MKGAFEYEVLNFLILMSHDFEISQIQLYTIGK